MKMKTTGYALREAIKQYELRRDTASGTFNQSLKKFPDEQKETPQAVIETFTKAEAALAKLQVAQMRYNLAVQVEANGERMSLAEAIKRIGGVGRIEKMWKSTVSEKNTRPSYMDDVDTRDPNQIRAIRTITAADAVKLAIQTGKKAGSLRAAIAVANGKEVEVEDLDSSLFE
jgi:hypothetical protein